MTHSPGPPSETLIAEDLLRVVLVDGGGSLPRRGIRERAGASRRLDVSLRAALFCDLVRSGHVTGIHGPVPAGSDGDGSGGNPPDSSNREAPAGAPPDRILAAVLAAVRRRPRLAWLRWFRHIREDRTALIQQLVRSGRWQSHGGNRFTDADPDGAQRLQARAFTVAELIEAPSNERDTILGYLYALAGPKLAPERVLGWDVRLAVLDAAPAGATLRRVLMAARSVSRPKRLRRR